jgi:hypothetical protein
MLRSVEFEQCKLEYDLRREARGQSDVARPGGRADRRWHTVLPAPVGAEMTTLALERYTCFVHEWNA